MKRQPVNTDKILSEDKFKEYYSYGLINETVLYRLKIRWDYFKLRSNYSKYDSIFILIDKYKLSYDAIYTAVFRKNK